jgi:hypothetical protein
MEKLSNLQAIADLGEKIYKDKYQSDLERTHPGEFVAIDVQSGKAYVGKSPESVYEGARKGSPNGLFHLIKIGEEGAYRVSYSSDGEPNGIFR